MVLEPPAHAAASLSAAAVGAAPLRVHGRHLLDAHGRVVQLRGFNVSGGAKQPTHPHTLSHEYADSFWKHESVSFVGRPFALADAPLHLSRLAEWGHPLIRLLVTWEALAHAGPRTADIDLEYVEYLERLLELCDEHGLKVVVCAHQDVWSRFSGGSGAPGWTFAAAGLDITAFKDTGAAYVHSVASQENEKIQPGRSGKGKEEPSGPFVWPSGYQKLAASSMATLFWAGSMLAWKLRVARRHPETGDEEKVSIQDFLQDAYLDAFGLLADRLGGKAACIGFDVMNEPHRGLIGLHGWHGWKYETDLHVGHYPSLLQSLALGTGHAQEVPFYVKSFPFPTRKTHASLIDPKGRSAWLSDAQKGGLGGCIWAAHGAWAWDKDRRAPVVLQENFFHRDPRPPAQGGTGEEIEWYRHCWAPFVDKFTRRMRKRHPHLLVFAEPIPNEFHPPWPAAETVAAFSDEEKQTFEVACRTQTYATQTHIETKRPERFIYAPHFYDLNVLFQKSYSWYSVNVQGASRGMFILRALYFGVEGLRKNYLLQLGIIVSNAQLSFGDVPVLIGEVGVPFDINNRKAFLTGNYEKQAQLMFALVEAMEKNGVGYTLWNYNPGNTVEHGDNWLSEDFSVSCASDAEALDSQNHLQDDELYHGGRCLDAIIRPYAVKVAGVPLSSEWDPQQLMFKMRWKNSSEAAEKETPLARTTEVYMPRFWFENQDISVMLTDGEWSYNSERQSLYIQHADLRRNVAHTLIVRGNDPPPPPGRWYNRLGFADWVVLGIVAASMWLVLLGTLWLIGSEMEKSTERRRYWELRDHQEL